MSLLTKILVSDSLGVKWAKFQRSLRRAIDNAGIPYGISALLSDIEPSDTEGVKWAKVGRWGNLLADNIASVLPGPAGVSLQAGVVNLALNDASKAVVFPTAFSADPIVTCVVVMPDNTGFVISASPDDSTITTAGFTALFGAAMPTGTYKMHWFASLPTP